MTITHVGLNGLFETPLFKTGKFTSHSGQTLPWKIECDVLTDEDWDWAARYISERIKFNSVEGVPRGGLKLAKALETYVGHEGGSLIVDDVLTTGGSMEIQRGNRNLKGYVLFALGPCPEWVQSIWKLQEDFQHAKT